ncbi:hypothetical protein [Paraburkholderia sp. XV]|uniref:hypothetical protein n=1 Tax=Paraburkholderia sp. XV TaxID=2831520 RepID=UPI001CD68451|nr:hypothetical protein [Paraburkholderia sp. XV]
MNRPGFAFELDRSLFSLLVRVWPMGTVGVTELAATADQRVREARLGAQRAAHANAITRARRKLPGELLDGWADEIVKRPIASYKKFVILRHAQRTIFPQRLG